MTDDMESHNLINDKVNSKQNEVKSKVAKYSWHTCIVILFTLSGIFAYASLSNNYRDSLQPSTSLMKLQTDPSTTVWPEEQDYNQSADNITSGSNNNITDFGESQPSSQPTDAIPNGNSNSGSGSQSSSQPADAIPNGNSNSGSGSQSSSQPTDAIPNGNSNSGSGSQSSSQPTDAISNGSSNSGSGSQSSASSPPPSPPPKKKCWFFFNCKDQSINAATLSKNSDENLRSSISLTKLQSDSLDPQQQNNQTENQPVNNTNGSIAGSNGGESQSSSSPSPASPPPPRYKRCWLFFHCKVSDQSTNTTSSASGVSSYKYYATVPGA